MSSATTIKVDGMTCDHFVRSVSQAVVDIDGVIAVDVDLVSGRVSITSSTPVVPDDLTAAVADAGYEVSS